MTLRRDPPDHRGWRQAAFLVVDFETTGLDPRRAAPLSVGWVPVEGGRARLRGAGYTLIRHAGAVPGGALGVTRLLPAELETAPEAAEVADVLTAALDGRLLVAHGAVIERAMLGRLGIVVGKRETVDTAFLGASLDRLEGRPDAPRPLGALAARLGLPAHRPHHSFGDALTTAGVFLALATVHAHHGAGRVADLLSLGRPRLHP